VRDFKKCFPPVFGVLRQARNRVRGGVLCRRSEPLTRSAACRIPFDRGGARCRCCVVASERSRRSVVQRAVWALQVVVVSPFRQFFACMMKRSEPLDIQAFVALSTVETFDEAVLHCVMLRGALPRSVMARVIGATTYIFTVHARTQHFDRVNIKIFNCIAANPEVWM
jgi:hypothetical protein